MVWTLFELCLGLVELGLGMVACGLVHPGLNLVVPGCGPGLGTVDFGWVQLGLAHGVIQVLLWFGLAGVTDPDIDLGITALGIP